MKKVILAIISICLIPSICLASWNAYITGARTKYTPSATLPTESSLSINAVKGQYAAFQVLTQANGEDVSGVNVACTTPVKGGDSLSAPVIYYQKPHNVYIPAIDTLTTGEYPDALIPKVDPFYSQSRDAFPFNVTRVSTNRIGAGSPLAYPVFGFAIQASGSGLFRSNTATTSPTIGGTFSGGAATNYHARIDGAGGIGTATFKWSSNAVHIKYAKYVSTGTVVTITTYGNHGFSVSDTVNITTSRQAYNGDVTVATDNVGGDYSKFTYVKNCGGGNFWYDGGGTAIKTWNETGVAIPTPAAAVNLSNGLTITFPDQTPAYAVGDEWEFYANTLRNELVWIDIPVPTDAVAGTYTSTITVSATAKSDITLNLSIVVYNLGISKTSSIPTFYMASGARDYVGYGHTGVATPDENLIKRYVELGLRHRISLHRLAPKLTWDGSNITNWTTHRDWIKPYFEGTWADGSALSLYTLKEQASSMWYMTVNGASVKGTPTYDLTANDIAYVTAYKTALDAEGWLSSGKIYWVAAEEPTAYTGNAQTAIQSSYHTIKGISPYFKNIAAKRQISDWIDGANLPAHMDVWASNYNNFYSYPRSGYDNHIAAGGELWGYIACDMNGCNSVGTYSGDYRYNSNNRPNMTIDDYASKLIGLYWLYWDNDVRGDLYWQVIGTNERWVTAANPKVDPWDCIYAFGSYGDGYYIYPGRVSKIGGTTDIPIESIRLKYLRIGLEDYEIFKLTSRSDNALAQVESAVGTGKWYFTSVPPSASNMETARTAILDELLGQPPNIAPTVTTTAVSSIAAATASSGGNVIYDGGGTVSARGVCWSASINPTTADSKTTDGSGTGIFTSSITGLSPQTTRYVRAYATNEIGTSYGENLVFTTLGRIILGTGPAGLAGTGPGFKVE